MRRRTTTLWAARCTSWTPPASTTPTSSTPPWARSLSYWLYQYKRTWRGSVTTSFLYPVLYLSAIGVGLGSLVNHHAHTVGGVRYIDFLAPGLLAATTMQVGGNEAMYPIMGAIKWVRTYFAMLATPLGVTDVLLGHLAWIALRLFSIAAIYLAARCWQAFPILRCCRTMNACHKRNRAARKMHRHSNSMFLCIITNSFCF